MGIDNPATIRPFLLSPQIKGDQLLKLLKEMSLKFTVSRDKIGDYGLDADRVSAYTLYYTPTHLPKFQFLFSHLPIELQDLWPKAEIIDYGMGPGSFSLAYLHDHPQFSGDIYGIDKSSLMIEQAEKLMAGLHPNVAFHTGFDMGVIPAKSARKRILIFGHSLNELGLMTGKEIIARLRPDLIFVIEPGTHAVFHELGLPMRQQLQESYELLYPCRAPEASCPMMLQKDNWCHQVVKSIHHEDIMRWSQQLNFNRKYQPMMGMLFGARDLELNSTLATEKAILFRHISETKYAFIWEVCLSQGDGNEIVQLEMVKKKMSKSEQKQFKDACAGLEVDFKLVKKIRPLYWRVELI